MAGRFLAIKNSQTLRADWQIVHPVGSKDTPETGWRVAGYDRQTKSARIEFEAVARRCGPEVYPFMDSLIGWLEEIKCLRINVSNTQFGEERDARGNLVSHIMMGSVDSVCQASADVCRILESLALETERLEREATERNQKQTTLTDHPRLVKAARALWLSERLRERGWNHNDPQRYHGPDRKTVQKILQGKPVREDALEKLAKSLSDKFSRVSLTDIPPE